MVLRLKQAGEDYEFYPSTDEIIRAFVGDLIPKIRGNYGEPRIASLLDIGAGNGKVLRAVQEGVGQHQYVPCPQLLAIEKSSVLYNELTKLCPVIGSDFLQQSLLGKRIDAVYCNPPYSEYAAWCEKILTESEAAYAWLIIPRRWQTVARIADAAERRDAKLEIVGSFDFLDAEDRKARAVVDLVRVTFARSAGRASDSSDAFSRFFDEQFGDLKERYEEAKRVPVAERLKAPAGDSSLVPGANLVERLAALYEADMEHTRRNYEMAAQLDVDLLRELHVSPNDILACLKGRLEGLRGAYWTQLFDSLKEVTNRLCSKQRERMRDEIKVSGLVDFSAANAYAIVCWLLNHANEYMTEQLLGVFDEMNSKANVRRYASNRRVFEEDCWRYNQEKPTHVALEYRLVLDRLGGIRRDSWLSGLDDHAADFLRDLMTVANNLGFRCDNTDHRLLGGRREWRSGQVHVFEYRDSDGGSKPLFEAKAYYNRNIHMRLGQDFALALNVEVGRARGWIRSAAEAARELDDPRAASHFGRHLQLGMSSVRQLGMGGE